MHKQRTEIQLRLSAGLQTTSGSAFAVAGAKAADEAYGAQPSSARASVASSDGYGPSSSRASRTQHEDSFGGGENSLQQSHSLCSSRLKHPS